MTKGAPPVLQIDDIHKVLGGKEILRGVSMTVDKGELKILIGPSGGGKSTLLQCINFLLPPDQGRIFLEGHEVHFHKKAELYQFRQHVGMIFQDFNLFDHLNALDNVSIALRKVKKIHKAEARERAYHELERVGLAEKKDLYPAELSGGQKQRVSIARALAMDPKVILLDEPTSALDPELIGEVLRVIVELARSGMTMIMATHQIGYVKSLTDEILFMENGRIIERGPPEKLLRPDVNTRCRGFCDMLNDLIREP
jgi:polar amino acid transport system ATP-binding protein